ncbi:MAG: serine hydrolase, partial [Planctomycetota bacterium]
MLPIHAARVCLFLLPLASLLVGRASAQTAAYHGVSSATHQTQFTSLSGQGYRLISLSVAGSLASPTYSAVWEVTAGPGWVSLHDMSATQYAAQRTTWISQGYRAKIITAAGTTSSTRVFAAVFINDGASVYDTISLTEAGFHSAMETQRSAGRYPVSADIYGDATVGHFYTVVCEPNTGDIVWGHNVDVSYTEFGETRLAHGEPDVRLACIGMSETQRYVSIWYDQRVGTETIASNQTGTGWQNIFNAVTGNGHYSRMVAAGGSGSALRFAGSFAQYRTPRVRTWHYEGSSSSTFASLDSYVQGIMTAQGHRAAAIAVAKNGKLVHARAFTLAESSHPITYPTSVFRIGSCAKPLTAFAAHEADELNYLSMTTTPVTALGLSSAVAWFPHVTMGDILRYTSGVRRSYTPTEVAEWLSPSSPQYPVSMASAANWLAAQSMNYDPSAVPTLAGYSNSAYLLAAEVIRVRTGQSYLTFLQNHVMAPLGITRIRTAPSEYSDLATDDVRHQLARLDLLPSELYTDRRRRSAQYAEDLYFKRGSGGMAASVVDYVRLLAGAFDLQGPDSILYLTPTRTAMLNQLTFPKYDEPSETSDVCLAGMAWEQRPGGVVSYSKGGWLPTNATADVCWRTDGVSWAVFFNSGQSGASGNEINTRIEAITNWPNVDLFPSYGLPAYPQRAHVDSSTPTFLFNVSTNALTLTGLRFDTVTHVNWGFSQITSTSPTNWANGYFVVTSPTTMEIHPPQGRTPGTIAVTVGNAVGASNSISVDMLSNLTFRIGAPTVVNPNQAWSAYIARGTLSGLTTVGGFGILCLSFSNQASVVPGIVSLGLGNQFADLVTSGAFQFSPTTSAYRFDLPALPSGTVYLEAVGYD